MGNGKANVSRVVTYNAGTDGSDQLSHMLIESRIQ